MIIWDKKLVGLLAICFILLFFASIFKLNGSSVDSWNTLFGRLKQTNVILGKARAVRIDEWMVVTPWMLSQAKHSPRFPLHNASAGAENIPLLSNLPVRGLAAFFRPQYWGFFILDFETAFSLYWNLKIIGLFLGFFLLLLLFTANNFWLSFFGSLWLLYSAFTQWWLSTPAMMPEMLASLALAALSILYIFFSQSKWLILFSGLVLIIAALNFLLCAYPAFQVPLLYLLVAIVAGFCYDRGKWGDFRRNAGFRWLSLAASFFGIGIILYFISYALKDTLLIIQNTEYPAGRISAGGGLGMARVLSGIYGFFLKENIFPKAWGNICEASNFIIISPWLLLPFIFNIKNWLKKERLLVILLIYQGLLCFWITRGFPLMASKLTLFSLVTEQRALIGLGLANILSAILFFTKPQYRLKWNFVQGIFFSLIAFLLAVLHGFWLNRQSNGFFYAYQIIWASFFCASLAYSLLTQRKFLFFMIIGILILPNLGVNPLARGLSPLMDQELTYFMDGLNIQARSSEWIVFGDCRVANFLKSTGVNVFNGTQAAPELSRMKVLDPAGNYRKIYNRYATISCVTNTRQDEASFSLNHNDFYTLKVHPCNLKLAQLGVNYFVFTYKPANAEVACLEPLSEQSVSGLHIYRR